MPLASITALSVRSKDSLLPLIESVIGLVLSALRRWQGECADCAQSRLWSALTRQRFGLLRPVAAVGDQIGWSERLCINVNKSAREAQSEPEADRGPQPGSPAGVGEATGSGSRETLLRNQVFLGQR
jgi:hypothetical protein